VRWEGCCAARGLYSSLLTLREGLEETVTLQRLRIDEQLWRTPPSRTTRTP
jgi:hypothetical protein